MTETRRCPYCTSEVSADATTCKICGGSLPVGGVPDSQPQPAPATGNSSGKSPPIAVIIAVVALVVPAVIIAVVLSTRGDPPIPAPLPIAVNSSIQERTSDAAPIKVYEFTLTKRGPVTINVTSRFDNFLELYGHDPNTPLATDDDSGGNHNARITRTLTPGTYYALVAPYSDGSGPFTLHISAPQEPATPPSESSDQTSSTETTVGALTETGARVLATRFYSTRSEWAGQYTIDRFLRSRLDQSSPSAATLHAEYRYRCIRDSCGGSRDGVDQRTFQLRRQGDEWRVTSMGGHRSASF